MSIAICPICHNKNEFPYWKIGLHVFCPSCKSKFLFIGSLVHGIGRCGESGFECTFSDFVQVVKTYMDHNSAQKVIGEHLNLCVVNEGGVILFKSASGEVLAYEMVHEMIQLKPAARGEFYNYAMSKWR